MSKRIVAITQCLRQQPTNPPFSLVQRFHLLITADRRPMKRQVSNVEI